MSILALLMNILTAVAVVAAAAPASPDCRALEGSCGGGEFFSGYDASHCQLRGPRLPSTQATA
jgi:hypothetical protein